MNQRTYDFVSDLVDTSVQRLCAIMSRLESLQKDCLALTCAGQLGITAGGQEQKDAAYAWMKQNYDRVNAAVFAASLLATDSRDDLETASMRLYNAENTLEQVKGGQHA